MYLVIHTRIYFRAVYSKRVFVSFTQQSAAKSDLYAEAEVIPEDSSHYQELGVSEGETPYQNTSLNNSTKTVSLKHLNSETENKV